MQSTALQDVRAQGVGVFPVLRVTWKTRKMSLGTGVYAPQARATAVGGVTGVTRPGGWERIEYGSGINSSSLSAVSTSVSVEDKEGDLLAMLETYDPRGSAASIDAAAPGLAAADWEPLFRGIVSDWARDGLYTKLLLKTDDTVLRTPVPSAVFNRTEWGSAAEGTIYGTGLALVTGVHDSFQVTARGMVPTVNIRYDKDLGYWWQISCDRIIDVTKLYFDGVAQGTGGWSILRGVYGGSYMTILVIAEGYQPEKGVVVSVDCTGPDENGLTLGATLTGAPDTLRMIINEYGYRKPPLAGWRGDHAVIHAASWDAVSEFFGMHKVEAARRFGGDQDVQSVAEVLDSFLEAYIHVRIWWTELGQLAIGVIDPDDVDPDDTLWLDLQKFHEGGQVPLEPGDRREVYSHVRMPFMWSSAEQKFLSAYEAHDVAALDEKVVLTIENPWTQARFDAPTLNPLPMGVSASASVSPSASLSVSMSASLSPSASPSRSTSASTSPSSSASPSI